MLGIPGNPLPTDAITGNHWVADVIYTPLETECLKLSRARSAKVMGGAGMCVHQAAETFRLFTGRAPDTRQLQGDFRCGRRRAGKTSVGIGRSHKEGSREDINRDGVIERDIG